MRASNYFVVLLLALFVACGKSPSAPDSPGGGGTGGGGSTFGFNTQVEFRYVRIRVDDPIREDRIPELFIFLHPSVDSGSGPSMVKVADNTYTLSLRSWEIGRKYEGVISDFARRTDAGLCCGVAQDVWVNDVFIPKTVLANGTERFYFSFDSAGKVYPG